MMRFIVCVLVVLVVLLLPLAACAWTPEKEFGEEEALPAAVRELLPEELAFSYAEQAGDSLYVWTRDAGGNRVVLAFLREDGACALLARSAPIAVWNGMEPRPGNSGGGYFSIRYSEDYTFTFGPWRDGRWALKHAFLYKGEDRFLSFYPHAAVIFLPEENATRTVFGSWTRSLALDTLDTAVLPATADDALRMLDTRGWATVQSPEPGGTVPLRAAPEAGGEILASYYTGAPAEILEERGAWLRVIVAGAEGWLPAETLALGDAMRDVAPEFPALVLTEDAYRAGEILYAAPAAGGTPAGLVDFPENRNPAATDGLFIIGVVNDAWYHVMNWWGETGYIESGWFFPGNG